MRALALLSIWLALPASAATIFIPGSSTPTGTPTRCARYDINGILGPATADCPDGDTGGAGGAPTNAGYWISTANGTLNGADKKNLGALTTGIILNTVAAGVGTPSAYTGAVCTNQFVRSLDASAAAACASVSLTADVTGTLAISRGGTGATDAASALTALGAQPLDADLTDLADGTLTGSKVQAADGSTQGTVTTSAQTFAGVKTFQDTPVLPELTVAALPAASGTNSRFVVVTDSATHGDCTVGGGAFRTLCADCGAAWCAPGDGVGAGASTFCTLNDVSCGAPQNGNVVVYNSSLGKLTVTDYAVSTPNGTHVVVSNAGLGFCVGGNCNPDTNAAYVWHPSNGWAMNQQNVSAIGRIGLNSDVPNGLYMNGLVGGIGIGTTPGAGELRVGLNLLTLGAVTFGGGVRAPVDVYTHASSVSISTTECSGGIIVNTGAVGAITYTLPATVSRLVCTFQVIATQTIKLEPSGADRILVLTDANGDSVTSPATAGSMLTIYSPADGNWAPLGRDGTWSDTN